MINEKNIRDTLFIHSSVEVLINKNISVFGKIVLKLRSDLTAVIIQSKEAFLSAVSYF